VKFYSELLCLLKYFLDRLMLLKRLINWNHNQNLYEWVDRLSDCFHNIVKLNRHFNIQKGSESMIRLEIQNPIGKLMILHYSYNTISFSFIVSLNWTELKIVYRYRRIDSLVKIY
jgi:hypothetical protein